MNTSRRVLLIAVSMAKIRGATGVAVMVIGFVEGYVFLRAKVQDI
jgi:hypothetical protein